MGRMDGEGRDLTGTERGIGAEAALLSWLKAPSLYSPTCS